MQQYNELKLEIDAIFMNSKNSKTSDPHKLLLGLSDKMNLKRSDKYVDISKRSIYYTWKNVTMSYKNLKYLLQYGMKNVNYLMDHILYHIFKIVLSRSLKNTKQCLTIRQ